MINFFLWLLYTSLCEVGKSSSSWSQVGDLPTCQFREFILFMCKNDCWRVQNATCQRAFRVLYVAKMTRSKRNIILCSRFCFSINCSFTNKTFSPRFCCIIARENLQSQNSGDKKERTTCNGISHKIRYNFLPSLNSHGLLSKNKGPCSYA